VSNFYKKDTTILLHQIDYVNSILAEYSTLDCTTPTRITLAKFVCLIKDTKTPLVDEKKYQGLVGKLHYPTNICTNIGFLTSLTNHYMHGPQCLQCQVA
jgi:hypothetical protein